MYDHGFEADGSLGPRVLRHNQRFAVWTGFGEQQGAGAHKGASPPVVSFGLKDEEHFACSLKASEQPTQFENFQAPEHDLQYATHMMVMRHDQLRSKRRHAARIFQELGLEVASRHKSPASSPSA